MYEYILKLLVVGDTGVGKSSIIRRLIDSSFSEIYNCTIAVDFKIKRLDIDSKCVRLNIWDCGGVDRFRTITPSYYANADAIIIVYDITRRATFEAIPKWLDEIKKYSGKTNANIILMGNKCDLDENRRIEYPMLQACAERFGIKLYYEVNARYSNNDDSVIRAFTELAKQMEDKFEIKKLNAKKEPKQHFFKIKMTV